ncbi:peptidoglycan-binding domain-containing protein [Enterobacillus tribolii]|uniref:peptidoglycan-binding domain-containing protein n=1 Tax=Enterobacillus tribolii TaxID=1487935 RepID=UPI000E1D9F7B|nr:peptidoglycan-binding protein [Enterobacillus tribolii]
MIKILFINVYDSMHKSSIFMPMQTRLRQRGYRGLRVDNKFGPATENTVKALQRRAGLVADGLVGKNTRRYLGM